MSATSSSSHRLIARTETGGSLHQDVASHRVGCSCGSDIWMDVSTPVCIASGREVTW